MVWIRLLIVALYFNGSAFASEVAKTRKFSEKEVDRIQEIGLIEPWQHILGTVVGYFPGFGLGHAVQGRFFLDGRTYAIGEGVSAGVFYVAFPGCVIGGDSTFCGASIIAAGTFFGFKIAEVFDLIFSPFEQNRKWRLLNEHSAFLDNFELNLSLVDAGGEMAVAHQPISGPINRPTPRPALGLAIRF
ncbi:hypothetical protein EBZ80_06400 [bacterium]|nr:hypothetical protein [bacterium]